MMNSVNSSCANPLYQQLAGRIRGNIEAGIWAVGCRLPSENELCEEFGVSRITVRKALECLTEEGLLSRKQGKGTFVTAPYVPHQGLKQVSSFHEACEIEGKRPSTKVIAKKSVPAAPADRRELQLTGNSLVSVTRIRMADQVPVVLEINRFPMVYSYLLECDLNGSLYNLLRGYGVEAVSASHDVSMCFADARQAELLQIAIGDPLIQLHEVVYEQHGRPLHTSTQYVRGDIFTLRV